MNMKLKTTFTTLTIAMAASLVAGCGSDNNNDGGAAPITPATQTSGKAVDFYLSGATVTFEDCTGKPTTTTTAEGSFAYPQGCNDTALTIRGGLDIGTQLPFTGVLKAPKVQVAGLRIASPLTTLIANSPDTVTAASVLAKLGLSSSSALVVDPMTNKELLQKTVVVQQFADQIQKTLLQLSASADGSLTAEQAALAASAALSSSIQKTSGNSVDLTQASLAQSAVEGAIRNAATNLPDSIKNNIDTIARNTAAVAAATIAEKVSSVNDSMATVVINANPAATLNALGARLDAIKENSTSAAAANLIDSVYAALDNANISPALLAELGAAAASGQGIANALNQVNNLLPVSERIAAGDLTNLDAYQNFLEMASFSVNNRETFNLPSVEKSLIAGQELSVESLNNIQLKLSKNGSPFQGNSTDVRVGVSYSINGNQLDFIISKVTMTFNTNGSLASVVVPADTPFFYRTNGSPVAQGISTNQTADNLVVTNGAVSLPLDNFLNRVSNVAGPAFNKALYTPKSGDTVKVNVALDALVASTTPLRVGLVDATKPRAANAVSIKTATSSLDGQGISAVIRIK